MISVKSKGNYKRLSTFMEKLLEVIKLGKLDKYGRMGVDALKDNTPIDTGKTADSWSYEIVRNGTDVKIYWRNSNSNDGENIAILLQYGHGLDGGGFVQGRDYINPAMIPIFEKIAGDAWEEVLNA